MVQNALDSPDFPLQSLDAFTLETTLPHFLIDSFEPLKFFRKGAKFDSQLCCILPLSIFITVKGEHIAAVAI